MNPIFLLQKMYGLNEKLFKELFDFHVKRPDYNGTVVMSLQFFILGHTAVISIKANELLMQLNCISLQQEKSRQ